MGQTLSTAGSDRTFDKAAVETMYLGPGLGPRGLKLISKEALVHKLVYMRGYDLGLPRVSSGLYHCKLKVCIPMI